MTRWWVCPSCGGGLLAPGRPRRDDVRRYCLPCSEATGRLVARTCPAADRERAARAERGREAALRSTERARSERTASRQVQVIDGSLDRSMLDVWETAERMLGLPSLRALQGRRRWTVVPPGGKRRNSVYQVSIVLRRSSMLGARGKATYWSNTMTLTVGRCVREELEELIVHELTHLIVGAKCGSSKRFEHHGEHFRVALLQAAFDYWPAIRAEVRNEGKVYAMDRRIWRAAREHAGA